MDCPGAFGDWDFGAENKGSQAAAAVDSSAEQGPAGTDAAPHAEAHTEADLRGIGLGDIADRSACEWDWADETREHGERLIELLVDVMGKTREDADVLVGAACPAVLRLAYEVARVQDFDWVAMGMASAVLERRDLPQGLMHSPSHIQWLEQQLNARVARQFQAILDQARTRTERHQLTLHAFADFRDYAEVMWQQGPAGAT